MHKLHKTPDLTVMHSRLQYFCPAAPLALGKTKKLSMMAFLLLRGSCQLKFKTNFLSFVVFHFENLFSVICIQL